MLPRKISDVENKLLLLLTSQELGPATSLQLLQFLVENGLMDYITMRLALGDLLSTGQLQTQRHALGELYSLTESGKEALRLFLGRVPLSRQTLIRTAAEGWRVWFQREKHMLSGFSHRADGQYDLRLRLMEKELPLLDMTLLVPSWEAADRYDKRWPEAAPLIYGHLMQALGGAFSAEAVPEALPDYAAIQQIATGDCRLTLTHFRPPSAGLTLSLSLPTEPMARHFAGRWPETAEAILAAIVAQLDEDKA